jgi:hypothetical protein
VAKRKRRTAKGKRAKARGPSRAPASGHASDAVEEGHVPDLVRDMALHPETGPRLTGGDLDADWAGASAVGDEAVGGSVATPDQDVVDEIGDALGVPQAPDAPVRTSAEILEERDRHRWRLEREAAREKERG